MHETRASGFYQLKKGVYVNSYNDTACFFNEGSFFAVYYRGDYLIYSVKCNPVTKLIGFQENKRRLTVDPAIRNYCDEFGNKIELSKKGVSFSLTIKVNEDNGASEIQKMSDSYVASILNSFLPVEYGEIVAALAEKPINIEITSEPAENVSLNISNRSTGSTNEYLLISKLLSVPNIRFVYDENDEEIEKFLRRHCVPRKIRWPLDFQSEDEETRT